MATNFRESRVIMFLEAKAGAKGSDWDVVVIESGLSKNGNFYSPSLLKDSVHMFEGLKIQAFHFGDKFDHLPEAVANKQFGSNTVGVIQNAKYGSFKRPDGSTGEGIVGRFHVLEGAAWLRANLRDSFLHNAPNLLGFSIDARGEAKKAVMGGRMVNNVERFDEVRSAEVVSEPAAGGSLLRLVASNSNGGTQMAKSLLDVIKAKRPSWLSGFSAPKGDVNDFATRVIEANIFKAREALLKIPADHSQGLAEAARGLKSLSEMYECMKEGKYEEAKRMLEDWMSDVASAEKAAGGEYAHPAPDASVVKTEPKEAAEEDQKDIAIAKTEPKKALAKRTGEPDDAADEVGEPDADDVKEGQAKEEDEEEASVKEAAAPVPDTGAPFDLTDKKEGKQMDEVKKKMAELEVKESKLRIKEALIGSGLPEVAKVKIEKSLAGKIVTDEQVAEAIKDEKAYIATFSESGKVAGLAPKGEITVGAMPVDKLAKGWDGFFVGHDVDGVPMFHTCREAYVKATGKYADPRVMARNIMQSIAASMPNNEIDTVEEHQNRLRESWMSLAPKRLTESITTSDFSVSFGTAWYRRLQMAYNAIELSDWRKMVSGIENLPDATSGLKIIRIGEQTVLPVVSQNAPYQEGTDPSEAVETMTPAKYGRLLKLTWEDVLADRVGVIRRIPQVLGRSIARTVQQAVFNSIENNVTMGADGYALISASHNPTNLLSGSPALTYDNFVAACIQLRNMTEQDSGQKLGLTPKYLIVGPDLEATAYEVLKSRFKDVTNHNATLSNANETYGVEAIVSVGINRSTATKNHWYVMANPADCETLTVGFLGGREMGDIFVQGIDTPTQGSFFDSDVITFKSRLVTASIPVDFRGIVGSLQ